LFLPASHGSAGRFIPFTEDTLPQTRTLSTVDPVSPATERMLGLSDALFGIAITFLALDFGSEVPSSVDEVNGYLQSNITGYLAYAFAFLVVGFQWWRHHWVFRFIKRRTDLLLFLNTTLLSFVALMPYGMQVLGQGIGSPICLAFFSGLMFCIGTLLWIIWEYAIWKKLTIPNLGPEIVSHMRVQLVLMPCSFLLIMGLAILAEMMQWRHEGLGLLLLLVLLGALASRFFRSPSTGNIEREIETAKGPVGAHAERSMLSRLKDGAHSERLTVFTDGVFAVAFTIMALRLRPPHHVLENGADFMTMVSGNSAALVAYFITFYVLSGQWMRHVSLFDHPVIADTGMLWINLVFLMFVAFMPFATELAAEPGGRTAVLMYLSVLSAATLTQMVMEIYANRSLPPEAIERDDAHRRNRLVRRLGILFILVVSVVLGLTMSVPEFGLYALVLFTCLDPISQFLAPLPKAK
jgi:uncharacterized membrane protein